MTHSWGAKTTLAPVRQLWSRSRLFRVVLVTCLVYTLLRLVVQGIFLATLLLSGQTEGHDLDIYLDAASNLQMYRDLYPQGDIQEIEFYQYSPAYALVFVPFAWLSFGPSAILLTIVHLVAYVLLYLWWARIFCQLGLERASLVWAWSLPLWLIFSAFWSDLAYINVYILMALLATMAIDAVLNERLAWAVASLSIIVQIKPQWAFVLALPLLLGRYRFFFKLLGLLAVVYVAVVAVTAAFSGPSYAWQQYTDYWRLLVSLSGGNYAWKEPGFAFLGYNHSITQVLVYLLGATPGVLRLSLAVRVVLLLPLAWIAWRHLRRPPNCPGRAMPGHSLDLVFIFYLAAFIWLNVVWELTLSLAIFAYLFATLEQARTRAVVLVFFLLYALLDVWRVLSLVLFGFDVFISVSFIKTDPALYLPVVLFLILALYAVLMARLWRQTAWPEERPG